MKFKWHQVLRLRNTAMPVVVALGVVFLFGFDIAEGQDRAQSSRVLEDFQNLENGFPQGWTGSRSLATAKEAYTVHQEEGQAFLKGKGANQRVYTKNIVWNPKTHPILKWRWRVHSIPDDADFVAGVFANLDTDYLFIPVSTKYVWSTKKSKGSVTDGGFFGAAEVVIRSGNESLGEWVEEEVNAYEDFKKIHNHEPAAQAWGISLQSGPGVEVDFGSIEIRAQ